MKNQRSYPPWIQALLVGCWFLSGLIYAPFAACDSSARLQQVMLAEDVSAKASLNEVLAGQLAFRPLCGGCTYQPGFYRVGVLAAHSAGKYGGSICYALASGRTGKAAPCESV